MSQYNPLNDEVMRVVYGGTLRTWANGGGEWTLPDGTKQNRHSYGGPAHRLEDAMALLCKVRGTGHFDIGSKPDGLYYCQLQPYPGDEPTGYGVGKTICEAICRAAINQAAPESSRIPTQNEGETKQ